MQEVNERRRQDHHAAACGTYERPWQRERLWSGGKAGTKPLAPGTEAAWACKFQGRHTRCARALLQRRVGVRGRAHEGQGEEDRAAALHASAAWCGVYVDRVIVGMKGICRGWRHWEGTKQVHCAHTAILAPGNTRNVAWHRVPARRCVDIRRNMEPTPAQRRQ